MYLAKTNSSREQYDLYLNVLNSLVEGNDSPSKPNIDTAISDAIKVVKGEKDILTISNSNYFLVSTLIGSAKEFLVSIKVNSYNREIYSGIISSLNQKR